jgi:hypothetical protein
MTAFAHRFDFASFRNGFAPRKPRHPLTRLLVGLLGVAVLVVLVFVSVFVGIAMLSVGLLLRMWKRRNDPQVIRDPRVVDGEFEVVRKHALPSA